MISLNSYSPQGQAKNSLIKNMLYKIKSKISSSEERSHSFTRPYTSSSKDNQLNKIQFRLQPAKMFLRSKTEVCMIQNLQRDKKSKISPPKCSVITQKKPSKRRKIDSELRMIAKTLVPRKSHKYYVYTKIRPNCERLNPEKPSCSQANMKKESFLAQSQEVKTTDSKIRKKYKLLQLTGNKINLPDSMNMQSFNNSSIYLQSNSEYYCG